MSEKHHEELPEIIRRKVDQRLQGAREKPGVLFLGLGLFGTVGWTIALPAVLGTFLGRWLDTLYPGSISWTLTGLLLGLAGGCFVAWRWLERQRGVKQ
ncbi:MAG: AtpZ/AtpI family protein [Deltaproteobacteria bacterium]|nr:AtpZ/AtpI family protein [Deltaproteobacteria bacterium]